MKRFKVTIKYRNINRQNELIVWAENEDTAKKQAIKSWRATIYESLTAVEMPY